MASLHFDIMMSLFCSTATFMTYYIMMSLTYIDIISLQYIMMCLYYDAIML